MAKIKLAKTTKDITILEKLSDDEDWLVRLAVAKNPSTPISILEKLSDDEYWRVRNAVANNPNYMLEKLIDDWRVRESVAKNPNTPPELKTFMLLKY